MREIEPINEEQEILDQLETESQLSNHKNPATKTMLPLASITQYQNPPQEFAQSKNKKSTKTTLIILACILIVGALILIPLLSIGTAIDNNLKRCNQQISDDKKYVEQLNTLSQKLYMSNGINSLHSTRDLGGQSETSCLRIGRIEVNAYDSLAPGEYISETDGAEIVLQRLANLGLPQYSKTPPQLLKDDSLVYSTVNNEGSYIISFERNDEGEGYLGIKVKGNLLEPGYAKSYNEYSKKQTNRNK